MVTTEAEPPGVITKNHNSAPSRILVGDAKGSAEQRLDSKGLEKTSCHSGRGCQFHLVAGSDRLASRIVKRDAHKILCEIAPIKEVGYRNGTSRRVLTQSLLRNGDNAIFACVRKRPEQGRAEDAEDRCVRSDPEREDHNRRSGES